MESERELREPDNSSAACSVVVGDGVGSDATPPKKKPKRNLCTFDFLHFSKFSVIVCF